MIHPVYRGTKRNEAEGMNKNKILFYIILIFMQRTIQTAHEISQQFTSLFRVSGKVHEIFLDKDYDSWSIR